MLRKSLSSIASAALVVGMLGIAPTAAMAQSQTVGETDLFNFEFVDNISFSNVFNVGAAAEGTDMEFFSAVVDVHDAAGADTGVTEERDFAVVGDHTDGIAVIDITNPEDAYVADYITCKNPRSDIGVYQWTEADGTVRTFVGSSRESGDVCVEAGDTTTLHAPSINPLDNEKGGFGMFEVTDPYDAQPFARVLIGAGGAHNFKFHPTAPVAYAWNGEIGGSEVTTVQIVDFTEYFNTTPAERNVSQIVSKIGPTVIGSPHDGELSPDGSVMYLASEYAYEIYDNSDPLNPTMTTSFAPNEGTYAHGYFPTPDGNIAITNNESLALGGFFVGGTTVCPGEGLAFYDTSTDVAIGPLGYFAPPVQGRGPDSRACTSHFGEVAPNNVVMSVGWYVLGGRVVDFSDPSLPVEIGAATISTEDSKPGGQYPVNRTPKSDQMGSEAWSAKFYKGPYMYVGDTERGFDIFKWTGPAECGSPFGDDWVGWLDCDDLDFRLVVDPSVPGSQMWGAQEKTTFTPAIAMQALAIETDENGQFRFSCSI